VDDIADCKFDELCRYGARQIRHLNNFGGARARRVLRRMAPRILARSVIERDARFESHK